MIQALHFALSLALVAGLSGCGGDKDPSSETVKVSSEVIDGSLVAKMWPVVLSSDTTRAEFEADPGWMHLFERSYASSLAAFKQSGNAIGMARVHQEYAAVYRQAALVAANATHHAYGEEGAKTDPLGLMYMVGVSRAIRGEPITEALSISQSSAEVAAHAKAWQSRDVTEGPVPSNMAWLEARVGALGAVVAGQRPDSVALPQYKFPERTQQAALVAANDPTVLLALSQWHLMAARSAVPELAGDMPLLMNAWRLPVEPPTTGALTVDSTPWLFGRTALCAEDLSFLAAVDAQGAGEVVSWADRSPLAAALAPAWDGEKLDHQVVLDQSVLLMRQAQAAMVATTGGEAGFHRPFALFVRLGVLRAGMRVADKAGQYRDAGILRLEALERMEGGKGSVQRDPAFALSVAAWDASNRSPLRPEDILHKLIPDFPALAAARSPLEALHLRLNRHAAPSTPVH